MIPSLAFLLYLVLSVLVGLGGRHRRIGFLGFFALSLLTTPLVGLLVLYLTEGPSASLMPEMPRGGRTEARPTPEPSPPTAEPSRGNGSPQADDRSPG
jgi:hypothetical protein